MDKRTPPGIDPVGYSRNSHINFGLITQGISQQVQEHSESRDSSRDQLQGRLPRVDPSPLQGAAVIADGSPSKQPEAVTASPASATDKHMPWVVKYESPWTMYKKGYELKFDQYVTVAVRRMPSSGRVAIRDFDARDASYKLGILRKISHERFVTVFGVFQNETNVSVVFDHSFTSLKQVVDSAAFPSRKHLTAIVSQVLEGMKYLHTIGLCHGSLTCTSVLVWPDGNVRIGNQENCSFERKNFSADICAIGTITMELMQKYRKDDGHIGIENLERWSADSSAIDFVSMTTSADSIATLLHHPFLRNPGRKQDLELLVELASITPRRVYRYHEEED